MLAFVPSVEAIDMPVPILTPIFFNFLSLPLPSLPLSLAHHNRIHLKNSLCQSDSLFLLPSEAGQQACLYAEMSCLAKVEPGLTLVNYTASSS